MGDDRGIRRRRSTATSRCRRCATPCRGTWSIWWGDDRFVPADHPLSNVHVATADLLDVGALSGQSGTGGSGADVVAGRTAGAPIPAGNIHAVPAAQAIGLGEGPGWAAERYARSSSPWVPRSPTACPPSTWS